eukprot:gnl/TRDRNA2_/TRDRNA2_108671_c1_seq1.p1 gnl/TRDRNA2_/TRDRNA2_108671_c1~~gnl/TRDRNA2_/TRDRNA2_108671_c1_seq1.p1  ORF type:complete len:109 (-),score=10.29 gnl/TRDRNA2_/TRDRNA2_108671_c1_seq1:107-433(-)
MDGNHFSGSVPEEWSAFIDQRASPREGAAAGGARIFLGYNRQVPGNQFGFECPYPKFLQARTEVLRNGKRVTNSNVATAWGLPFVCGLTADDRTPDEEVPFTARTREL